MNKPAYLQKLKRLIKQYHPDLCGDERLESVYNEITVKLTAVLNSLKNTSSWHQEAPQAQNEKRPASAAGGVPVKNALASVQDQGYAWYRSGIQYYRKIHPDTLLPDRDGKRKTYEQRLDALNEIFFSFNLAQYCFTQVLTDCPDSPWKEDAVRKIKLLKKLYKSYENISPAEETGRVIDNSAFVKEMGLRIL